MRALPAQDQLEQIVKARLASIDAFDSDAITWYALASQCEEEPALMRALTTAFALRCASKIAAVSGDARRALQICRYARAA
jgi:Cdc6-like AAA superfamily ATPase